MDGSKRPGWLIVAVVAGFAAMAYIAWRPQPTAVAPAPQPIAAKPASTAPAQARPTAAKPAATPLPQVVAPAVVLAPDPAVRSLASTSGPDDWAMEGSNPSRNRATAADLALPLSQQRALAVAGDTGTGSPLTIARDTILVESPHRLRAFDLHSGAEHWSLPLNGIYISPAVAGNIVFVRSEADNKGQLLALDIRSGQQLWAFTPKRLSSQDNAYFGGHLTSPVVVDGTVYVGAGKEVYALDAGNGSVLWEFAAQDYISSSATVADGHVYISDFRYFYSIDQRSGVLAWSYPTTMSIYFSPVAADQIVMLTDGDKLTALDPASGKLRWTVQFAGEKLIPGAVQGSRVFVKSTSTISALDLTNGKELWRFNDRNFISLPAVADNLVFVVSGSGADSAVVALDAASGRSSWRQQVGSLATTAPVIAGKTIYVRTGDGRVLGFWH